MEKWQVVAGCGVCTDEQGRVIRCTKPDQNGSLVPAAPYKYSKVWRNWSNATGVKLTTLKSGISRGTYKIM
jgi:hypothetical protein